MNDDIEITRNSDTTADNNVESIADIVRTTTVEMDVGTSDSQSQTCSGENTSKRTFEKALWFIVMLLVVAVMFVPIILYYTRPPTVNIEIPNSNIFDEETCLVSYKTMHSYVCTMRSYVVLYVATYNYVHNNYTFTTL